MDDVLNDWTVEEVWNRAHQRVFDLVTDERLTEEEANDILDHMELMDSADGMIEVAILHGIFTTDELL